MRRIYLATAVLVLYGDLLKRVLQPSVSLACLYLSALVVLASIYAKTPRRRPPLGRHGRTVLSSAVALIEIITGKIALVHVTTRRVLEGVSQVYLEVLFYK